MKRIQSVLLAFSMLFLLTACSSRAEPLQESGDLHRIETVIPYTADFDELRDVKHAEMQQGVLPELKESNLDISVYDTVFVGYPVWATDVPQAVLSPLAGSLPTFPYLMDLTAGKKSHSRWQSQMPRSKLC